MRKSIAGSPSETRRRSNESDLSRKRRLPPTGRTIDNWKVTANFIPCASVQIHGRLHEGDDQSLISGSDASALTTFSMTGEAASMDPPPPIGKVPPMRKMSPGDIAVTKPTRSSNHPTTADSPLPHMQKSRTGTAAENVIVNSTHSNSTADTSKSPMPPTRKASLATTPPLPETSPQLSTSSAITPPSRKQSPVPPHSIVETSEGVMPELKRNKHVSFSRKGIVASKHSLPSTQTNDSVVEPPSLHFRASEDTIKMGNLHSDIVEEEEELRSDQFGPGCRLSMADLSDSSISRDPSGGSLSRRVSSLTFFSRRAPQAPGENNTESPVSAEGKSSEESEQTSQNTPLDGAIAPNSSQKPREAFSSPIEKRPTPQSCSSGSSDEVTSSSSSSSGAVSATSSSTTTSIRDQTTPRVPGPTLQLHLDQHRGGSVPLAGVMVAATCDSGRRRNGVRRPAGSSHRVVSFVGVGRPDQCHVSNREGDDTSRASRTTIRSWLTAKWSLILPSRRLESMLPNSKDEENGMVVAVEATKAEPLLHRKFVLAGFCALTCVIGGLVLVIVILSLKQKTSEGSMSNPGPLSPTMAPTIHVSTEPLATLPPKTDIPSRPGIENAKTTRAQVMGRGFAQDLWSP